MELKAPIHAYLELTQACNLKCGHCYNPNKYDRYKESLDKIEDVANSLIDWDIFNLTISGGEVFLRKNAVYSVLDRLKEEDIDTSINTNLTLVTEEDAKLLKEYGVSGVLTSLNASQSELHDKIVNKKASFNSTIKGIERIIKEEIPVSINFVATKDSVNELYNTARLVKELGVNSFTSSPLIPNITNSKEEVKKSLVNHELMEYLWTLYSIKEDFNIDVSLQRVVPYCFFWDYEDLRFLANVACQYSKNGVNVRSNGDVTLCVATDRKFGNILDDNKDQIWANIVSENKHINKSCSRCDFEYNCSGGCRVEIESYKNLDITFPYFYKPIKRNKQRTNDLTLNMEVNPNFRCIEYREENNKEFLLLKDKKDYFLVSEETLWILENIQDKKGIIVDREIMENQQLKSKLEELINFDLLKLKEE